MEGINNLLGKPAPKTKRIFIVRHGQSDGGGDQGLSTNGVFQAKRLGKNIKDIIGDDSVTMWSSAAQRAKETAAMIDHSLDCDFNQFELLWADNWHQHDFKWLEGMIENWEMEDETNNLVIVTHLEYVNDFPRRLVKEGGVPGNHGQTRQF